MVGYVPLYQCSIIRPQDKHTASPHFFSISYTYYICLRIVICPKCPQPCRWSFMLSCSTHSPLHPPQVRNCSSLFFLTRRRPPHRPYPAGLERSGDPSYSLVRNPASPMLGSAPRFVSLWDSSSLSFSQRRFLI